MTSQRQVIAVDVDDVLFPFREEFVSFVRRRYGLEVTVDDLKSFDLSRGLRISPDETIEIVGRFYFEADLASTPPLYGALEAIDRLRQKYELVVVSGRSADLTDLTREWIDRHFRGLFSRTLLGNHFMLQGAKVAKSTMCAEAGATIIVDDYLGYILECANHGIRGILYGNYGWSKTRKLPRNVDRALNWQRVCELLL